MIEEYIREVEARILVVDARLDVIARLRADGLATAHDDNVERVYLEERHELFGQLDYLLG